MTIRAERRRTRRALSGDLRVQQVVKMYDPDGAAGGVVNDEEGRYAVFLHQGEGSRGKLVPDGLAQSCYFPGSAGTDPLERRHCP